MNMRKFARSKGISAGLSPLSAHILHTGLFFIYLSLLRLGVEIFRTAPFSPATAEDFGRMLEYPVAALMLLTASVFLVEKALRAQN